MSGARNYLIVTASYWSFTLTDGALTHAGAAALLCSRLYAVHAGVALLALRNGRHLRQSRRRLARDAFRHPAHARNRPRTADRRPLVAVRAGPGLGRDFVRCLGGHGARHLRRGQGHHQDRLQIRDQGDLRRWCRAVVPLGGVVHRFEERDERLRLFRRRFLCSRLAGFQRGVVADGRDARGRARERAAEPANRAR